MADSMDVRGIRRGKCRECHCQQYHHDHGQTKCRCGHPPGKHENLSAPPQTLQSGTTLGYSSPSGISSSFVGEGEPFTAGAGHYGYSGAAYPTSYQHSYDPQPQYRQPQYRQYRQYGQPDPYQDTCSLPLCKVEVCKKLVFCDSILGAFDYCSPKCRDTHLLPQEQKKLEKDLKKFTDDLCKNAPRAPSPPQEMPRTYQRQQSNVPRPVPGGSPTSDAHSTNGRDKAPRGKKKQQNTVPVRFKNVKEKGFGLIFSEIGYSSDTVSGFMITGVERDTEGYKLFQDDKLRLLDIVVNFDGNPVSTDAIEKANTMRSFSLTVDRSKSLAPTSKLLSHFKTQCSNFSHVLALRSPKVYDYGDNFGLSFHCGTEIFSVAKGSSSRISGLEHGDRILMCATADQEEIKSPSFSSVETTLKHSFPKEKSLVVAISRKARTTL